MSQHTPGPWTAIGPWVSACDGLIAFTSRDENRDPPRLISVQAANTRLITAAPELLLALQETYRCLGQCITKRSFPADLAACQNAVAALQKAVT